MVQPAEDKRDLGLETWCRCVSTFLCSKNKASTCIYIDVDAVGTRGGPREVDAPGKARSSAGGHQVQEND